MHEKIFRTINPELYDMIQRYRVRDDSLMPWAYQFANPEGRPYHNDWGIISNNPVLKVVQPWQRIRRMDTAYRIPIPFLKVAGTQEPIPTRWNGTYPIAPGTPVFMRDYWDGKKTIRVPHVLSMHPVYNDGWSRQKAWIGDDWVECYFTSSKKVFGRRLTYYYGLRPDWHHQDTMCWFPEASFSWKKVT